MNEPIPDMAVKIRTTKYKDSAGVKEQDDA